MRVRRVAAVAVGVVGLVAPGLVAVSGAEAAPAGGTKKCNKRDLPGEEPRLHVDPGRPRLIGHPLIDHP